MDHKVLLSKLLKVGKNGCCLGMRAITSALEAAAEILALKEVEVEEGQRVAVKFKMGLSPSRWRVIPTLALFHWHILFPSCVACTTLSHWHPVAISALAHIS